MSTAAAAAVGAIGTCFGSGGHRDRAPDPARRSLSESRLAVARGTSASRWGRKRGADYRCIYCVFDPRLGIGSLGRRSVRLPERNPQVLNDLSSSQYRAPQQCQPSISHASLLLRFYYCSLRSHCRTCTVESHYRAPPGLRRRYLHEPLSLARALKRDAERSHDLSKLRPLQGAASKVFFCFFFHI